MKARPPDTFTALADPTRRAILELLRDEGTLAAGDIAARFPGLSRAAVSKHVGVLKRSGVVRSRAHGRETRYRLERAPLTAMYRDWLSTFVAPLERSLEALKQRVESNERQAAGEQQRTPR